jgi:hypothetical protein
VGLITACISGEPTHTHHHFDLILKNVYPVQIHTLSLAMFASFVAPFGGFLASAIKRAYGIKNFDSIIPGHGGVMDRFDCQLLMGKAIVAKMICALCVCWCVLKFLTTCFLCSTWCLGVLQHIYKDDDCFRFQDGVHVQSFERSRQS